MAENKKQNRTAIIAECAVMIALGTILAQIKIFRMPQGGSVTAASMVPFFMIAYRHGTKWGLLSGFINALLQMMLGGVYPPVAPGALGYILEIIFDYFGAYMVLGLAYAFSKPFKSRFSGILFSSMICCFLRFLCAFISGFAVWADVMQDGLGSVVYSLSYNAGYMVPESLVNVIVLCILYKTSSKLFTSQRLL